MKKLARLCVGPMVAVFMFASAMANPAMAEEKAKPAAKEVTTKVLLENDKVRVTESTWTPGAESMSVARLPRVVRSLTGGTLTRIYPDGKTEKITRKKGEVSFFDATPPYIVKNEGKTTIVLYVVVLK